MAAHLAFLLFHSFAGWPVSGVWGMAGFYAALAAKSFASTPGRPFAGKPVLAGDAHTGP
jgi:hypothetical protein